MRSVDRRTFLEAAALTAAAAFAPPPAAAAGSPKKAVLISMLPKELGYEERFKLAREAGFAGIEMRTVADKKEAAAGHKALRDRVDRRQIHHRGWRNNYSPPG